MGSTRLEGKVMKSLQGKTVLSHDIERIKQSKLIDEIIIATTTLERDNIIVEEAIRNSVKFFRGSEDDVLERYYLAAKENNAGIIVRLTSDCPLIDPHLIDEMISYYLNHEFDLVTNGGEEKYRTYPRGLDTEVFSMESLEKAYLEAKQKYQREHVTPYIYENSKSVFYYKNNIDYSHYRWTLDTNEDFELINEIYKRLYKGKHDFYLKEVLELFNIDQSLYEINKEVKQKPTSN
ncbi:glycosyltransferase family protein [Clostridiaceae bacterium 35-E11]